MAHANAQFVLGDCIENGAAAPKLGGKAFARSSFPRLRFTFGPLVPATLCFVLTLCLGIALPLCAQTSSNEFPQTFPQDGPTPADSPYPRNQAYQQNPPTGAPLSPEQLDALVAPVALYPDPLLAQVLAACTYPLELVEARQWVEQHRDLRSSQLIEAARRESWDASVQALVAFPEVLARLTGNIRWSTDIGNAFLAQQAEVMEAAQRMRARARARGTLRTTPQQHVTTQSGSGWYSGAESDSRQYGTYPYNTAQYDTRQDGNSGPYNNGQYDTSRGAPYGNGQDAIAIQPADPQAVYVPRYDPNFIWGPPPHGAEPWASFGPPAYFQSGYAVYPQSGYPYSGYPSQPYSEQPYSDSGSGFDLPVFLGSLFTGLLNFGGWGWGLNWLTHGLFLNGLFLNHFGFDGGGGYGGYGGGYGGNSVYGWSHNPEHRLGVAYPRAIAARFNTGGQRIGSRWRSFNNEGAFGGGRAYSPASEFSPLRSFSSSGAYSAPGGARGFANAFRNEYRGGSASNNSHAYYSNGTGLSYGNRGFGTQAYPSQGFANRGYADYAHNFSNSAGRGFSGPAYSQDYRGFSDGANRAHANPAPQQFARDFRNSAPSTPGFAAPRRFSETRAPSQHFSAPHFSAPKAPKASSGGHFSASHFSSSHGSSHSGRHFGHGSNKRR